MKQIQNLLAKLKCQKGQGTVEYALVVLAVAIIIGVVLFGPANPWQSAMSGAFTKAASQIGSLPS